MWWLYPLLVFASVVRGEQTARITDIAVVQGSSLATPIALEARSFTDLITNGNIFVDKSLIIKHILDNDVGRMKLVARPPGWGKTMVLDMVRKFFALEFDKDGDHVLPDERTHGYKLFELGEYTANGGPVRKLNRPLLISRCKSIMQEHRGHYPVLYAKFGGFKPKTLDEFMNWIASRMRESFRAYNIERMANTLRSIGRPFDEPSLQRLRNFTESQGEFEWKDLRTMCELLEKYFKRKPLILFDDYDNPMVEVLADHALPQRKALVKAITRSYVFLFMELKEGDFYTHAMLTCVTKIMYENYTQEGDVCGVHETAYTRFHGFHDDEVETIFHHLKIPADLFNKTKTYYGGYQVGRFDQNIFNPTSIAKFVSSRKFQPYWSMTKALESIFDRCLKNAFFRHLIHKPVSAQQIYRIPMVDHNFDFHSIRFAKFLDEPESAFPYGWSEVCLGYGAGYLTNGVEYDPELTVPYYFEEAIPNAEVRVYLENKLKLFYAAEVGVKDFKGIEALARFYETFLYSGHNTSKQLCEIFNNFLSELPALKVSANSPFSIDHIERRSFHSRLAHSFLNFLILFLPGFELLDSNYCDDDTDARAFLTMSRGDFGVVQRMTFGYDTPDYAFRLTNQLPSRIAPFSFPHIHIVRRVGINYPPERSVQILALTTNITQDYDKIIKRSTMGVFVSRETDPDSSDSDPHTEYYGTVNYNVTDNEGMTWNHSQRYWMGNKFDFSKEMEECLQSNESISL